MELSNVGEIEDRNKRNRMIRIVNAIRLLPLSFLMAVATGTTYAEARSGKYTGPLGDRSWGIEISPLFLMGPVGTVSNFSLDRSAEIALPYLYLKESNGTKVSHLDLHYRRFVTGVQEGAYFSGFVRFQHVIHLEDDDDDPQSFGVHLETLNRGGAGLGVGFRAFTTWGLYWGCNVSIGRYFTGNPEPDSPYPSVTFWAGKKILDFEFLKVGYAF